MRAKLTSEGMLTIICEDTTEDYAMNLWLERTNIKARAKDGTEGIHIINYHKGGGSDFVKSKGGMASP